MIDGKRKFLKVEMIARYANATTNAFAFIPLDEIKEIICRENETVIDTPKANYHVKDTHEQIEKQLYELNK